MHESCGLAGNQGRGRFCDFLAVFVSGLVTKNALVHDRSLNFMDDDKRPRRTVDTWK